MVDLLRSGPDGTSRDNIDALRAIAVGVLARVAYGQPRPFSLVKTPDDPNARMSYTEAVHLCTLFVGVVGFVPLKWLQLSFMPKPVRTLASALIQLPDLTKEILDGERKRAAEGHPGDNIVGTLVRLSDQLKNASGADAGQSLTEDMISGNMFLFTAAGYDTTANTMGYAVTLLAAYPEWQRWIQVELDEVLGTQHKDGEIPNYNAVFPKLTRVLAVMVCPAVFPHLT